jgi:hypothetical protein
MVAKSDVLTFEELRDDCWPVMFEETTDEDVRWLRNVADLLGHRAREREATPPSDDDASSH